MLEIYYGNWSWNVMVGIGQMLAIPDAMVSWEMHDTIKNCHTVVDLWSILCNWEQWSSYKVWLNSKYNNKWE